MKYMVLNKPQTDLFFNKGIDRIFDDLFTFDTKSDFLPKLNANESDKAFYVEVEVPGMESKNIDISLDDKTLTISGHREDKKESKEENRLITERLYGTFKRSITFTKDVNSDEVKAVYKDGILNIEIPKKEQKEAKKIEVTIM